ncbi:hypothetical protein OIO90_004872 [Microbotryomycetes sp. JL221]|nr:hypothetical protein OIO90_004872 [Microbotryomycetes sp. JL221]
MSGVQDATPPLGLSDFTGTVQIMAVDRAARPSPSGRTRKLTEPARAKGTACKRCKARRVRCTGQNGQPCTACLRTAKAQGRDVKRVKCAYPGINDLDMCTEQKWAKMKKRLSKFRELSPLSDESEEETVRNTSATSSTSSSERRDTLRDPAVEALASSDLTVGESNQLNHVAPMSMRAPYSSRLSALDSSSPASPAILPVATALGVSLPTHDGPSQFTSMVLTTPSAGEPSSAAGRFIPPRQPLPPCWTDDLRTPEQFDVISSDWQHLQDHKADEMQASIVEEENVQDAYLQHIASIRNNAAPLSAANSAVATPSPSSSGLNASESDFDEVLNVTPPVPPIQTDNALDSNTLWLPQVQPDYFAAQPTPQAMPEHGLVVQFFGSGDLKWLASNPATPFWYETASKDPAI